MQLNKQRRKDRKICLQVLYSNVVAGVDIEAVLNGTATMPYIEDIDDYASNLIRGTFSNQDSIDEIISKAAKNWSLGRMPVIDKCLLRQTIFEMMYVDDVPISVSINEAVELAKEFGGEDDSHKYVNGVLGKIARDMESK